MKEIQLSQGLCALVDDDDFDMLVAGPKWFAVSKGTKEKSLFYAVRNIRISEKKKSIQYMHRLIVHVPAGMVADHINHNALDNRKENLRVGTHGNNMMNTRSAKNRNGYRGVDDLETTFRARISINKKLKHIGCFKTVEEAARAYDAVALKEYGEFANLNFPANREWLVPSR